MRKLLATLMSVGMVTAIAVVAVPGSPGISAAEPHHHIGGTLDDGTTYAFDWPADWNGTAFVDLDYATSGDAVLADWLLDRGYAIGGTERNTVGYRYAQAADNMVETLREFEEAAGRGADVAVVWGRSRGGFVARKSLERHPGVFDGGLAACGGGNGAIATFNQKLDALFVLKHLLDVDEIDDMRISGITDPGGVNSPLYQQLLLGRIVDRAMETPERRARLALAASFSQVQPWSDPALPRPGVRDWDAQLENIGSVFAFGHPAVVSGPIEMLAGGNVFSNSDSDYRELFAQSARKRLVRAAYAQAGLSIDDDLAQLDATPRVASDPDAVDFMEAQSTYTGEIDDPILTMHTIGDPADPLPMERGYTETIQRAGNGALLRQVMVDRPGHCNFRRSETLAGMVTLLDRIETGRWQASTRPDRMNTKAVSIRAGAATDLGAPDFVDVPLPHPLKTWDGSDW